MEALSKLISKNLSFLVILLVTMVFTMSCVIYNGSKKRIWREMDLIYKKEIKKEEKKTYLSWRK